MKFVLIDYTNNGVLFVFESQDVNKLKWDFNILQSCILDTFSHGIPQNSPVNSESIKNSFFIEVNNIQQIGNEQEINETFLYKKNKAKLIFPLISKLTEGLNKFSGKFINKFPFAIDDTLAHQLSKCDPNINYYSTDVIRYSSVVGMTPAEAYKEISLEVDTIHSIKMRMYATTKKYENLIREVTTQEQADILLEEIEQKLIRECLI
jgi:hypothetical protein